MELDVQWLESVEQRLSDLAQTMERRPPPTIFRTPKKIRDVLEDAYEPKMISIGPYHGGREHLKAMEIHKWRYLHKFLSRQPNLELQELLRTVQQLEGRARSCYQDATDELDRNQFVETMTLDACFLIELVIKENLADEEEDGGDPIFSQTSGLSFLIDDILLLENQVPFFVLKEIWALYCGSNDHHRDRRLIGYFLKLFHTKSPIISTGLVMRYNPLIFESPPHHLLDLFHSYIVPNPKMNPTTEPEPSEDCGSSYVIMPNATLLENASVKFRAVADVGILKVSFSNGWMDLSALTIEDATESLLRNLIAYEQCFPNVGNMISSYMVVMDCLIDTADDVAVLKESGILRNELGNDEEVALLFNMLGKNIVYDDTIGDVHHKVSLYYNHKYRKWKAQLLHDYFSSPWSIISVLAATLLFVLTFVQTYFSVISFGK